MPDEASVQGSVYAAWRASDIGRITEQLELDLVLELAGPLEGAKVLDVGTGDVTYAIAATARDREEFLAALREKFTQIPGTTVITGQPI